MKLPKLKYYYYACNETEYAEFERTRRIETSPLEFDMATGGMSGRPYLTLCATAGLADDLVRQHYRHDGAVFVLRIPRELVDRRCLKPRDADVYHYSASLEIDHCGVYRYDLDKSSASTYTKPIAAADILQIPITQ